MESSLLIDWLTFYIPRDAKYIIWEMLFPTNHLQVLRKSACDKVQRRFEKQTN